ncbi:MAG: radical SAM protein [Desulfomonile tiedjei]|nr:radical SAM protein [Desulfomonile tiedjei]
MKRPEILLVNPWIHDFAAYDLWARPLGLLVLAARLRKEGWEPRLVDCLDPDHPAMPRAKVREHAHGRFARSPIPKPEPLQGIPRSYNRYGVHPEFIEKDLLSIQAPRAILVTGLMTYWYPGVRETVLLLKKVFPRIPVLLGGVYASLLSDHARQHSCADEVLVGPGEKALASALQRHTGVSPIGAPHPTDLEFSPALDLLRVVRFLPLITSRGCPFRCAYCASARLSPFFVRRDPAAVVQEIHDAVHKYGVQDIALYDDAFLVDADAHALPILEAAAERFPGLRWHSPNGLHASAINQRVAHAMKKAGFETIRIGLESSVDEFHLRTGGKTDMNSFISAVRGLKEAGFSREQIGVYLLVGLPGQSPAQVENGVERVLQAGAFPKLAEYSPIPGTRMWDHSLETARYPIDNEPLFQNCTLLPTAENGVDAEFLQRTRKRITDYTESA